MTATLLESVLTFATGSVFGVIVALVIGYFLIKIVLAKFVALLATVGLAGLGWLLPKPAVSFLRNVVTVAEKTQGPKILQFRKR